MVKKIIQSPDSSTLLSLPVPMRLPTIPQTYKNPTRTLSSLPLNPSPNINHTFPLYDPHNNTQSASHSNTDNIRAMATCRAAASIILLSMFLVSTSTSACGTTCELPPKPTPEPPTKVPPANPFCPRDTLKLGVCGNLLGLVNVVIGSPVSGEPCCTLLKGLADLEAAACLCTAIKANVLGINLNVPMSLSALVSACSKTIPPGFKCV